MNRASIWQRPRNGPDSLDPGALDVGCRRYGFHCVGEAAQQEALAFMAQMAGPEFPVVLETEEPNEHHPDRPAIVVMSAFEVVLGYFPREDAALHCAELAVAAARGRVVCNARLIGGPQKGPGWSWGLVLNFDDGGAQRAGGHMDGSSRRSAIRDAARR